MEYRISMTLAAERFIVVEALMPVQVPEQEQFIQLPSWRPGRYELGNFAKNVRAFSVTAKGGMVLPFRKVAKDRWVVDPCGEKTLKIRYEYYAVDLNAGSSFIEKDHLYVNPINCLVYDPFNMDQSHVLYVDVPEKWTIACGKEFSFSHEVSAFKAEFSGFHELADSPFIAAPQILHHQYEAEGTNFHIWIKGVASPDWTRIERDFKAFTVAQIKAFGKMTVPEYHFLIHAPSFAFYHGVEHIHSSVNVLGPGYDLMEGRYDDLLGLCSHELYHSWNIKSIRPVEMFPYDYSKENYFRTGFVAEGVTTYMGDVFLLQSRVFSVERYLAEFSVNLQRHWEGFGRKNYSVADSSYDTWLDGYVPGVPGRKVSIYMEGSLIAFVTDQLIMQGSANKYRLHDVMKELYHEFALKGKGYSEEDYKKLVEKYAGIDLTTLFNDLVYGFEDYLPWLEKSCKYLGLKIERYPSTQASERYFGIRLTDQPQASVIAAIWPDAQKGVELNPGDQIVAVNNYQVKGDAQQWIRFLSDKEIRLTVFSGGRLKDIYIKPTTEACFEQLRFTIDAEANPEQIKNREIWMS